jgi:NAD(P)-dependent dehydrogenase (short-subunit alcohol dehydrogenase family)
MGMLSGKVAIITGATRGLGYAGALEFAKEGAKLILAGTNGELGAKVQADTKALGAESVFVKMDVTDEMQCKALIDKAVEEFGTIDVLYNNAGVDISAPVIEYTKEQMDKSFSINFGGSFFCCKYAIPVMIKNGGGSIINTGSIASFKANNNNMMYSATKFALLALTKAIAMEYGKYKIRCNTLCPGYNNSEMVNQYFDSQPDPAAARQACYNVHPLGRIGEPHEQGKAAVFLASDNSSFMTGTELLNDGGILCWYS